MDRPHSYTYPFQTQGHTRYASSHGTSSAFSASANPNEDWTKISDLAERRRIQNRIAQRNYRKKLKRRLEDLERRAASSSASPEQSHQELAEPETRPEKRVQASQSRSTMVPSIKRQSSPEPLNDFLTSPEDRGAMFSQHVTRQLSASPPPAFSYSTYPPADPTYFTTYPSQLSFQTLPLPYIDNSYQSDFANAFPTPYTALSTPSGAIKRETYFPEEELLSPFSMNYASLASIDINGSQAFSDTSVQVNAPDFLASNCYP